jgi:ribosomal protein S18 acetylase RimI-like enzyme
MTLRAAQVPGEIYTMVDGAEQETSDALTSAGFVPVRIEDRYSIPVRIWIGPRLRPRLGLVGALPGYRRRGLASALIARAFAPLVERGETVATAEADRGNEASTTLLARLGAVVEGGDVELCRAAGRPWRRLAPIFSPLY